MDTALNPVAAQGATSAAGRAAKPAITSDFQTFLRMLTVQMQNQDPLNPIDSADYAVQLATFSGVEQQVQTNDLLKSLALQFSVSGLGQMAGWVGREVRAVAPVAFDGAPVDLMLPTTADAIGADLVVRDMAGQEVQRIAIGAAGGPMRWDGLGDDGLPLPVGLYDFAVEAFGESGTTRTLPVESYAAVTEAQLRNGEIWLSRAGGAEIPASAVAAIRGAQ